METVPVALLDGLQGSIFAKAVSCQTIVEVKI